MNMDHLVSEIKELKQRLHHPVPNPAPLGLFAFGLTTALLNLKHSRIIGSTRQDAIGTENLVWGFALFYGGLLQLIAGLGEIRRNNIFGYTGTYIGGGKTFHTSILSMHLYILYIHNLFSFFPMHVS